MPVMPVTSETPESRETETDDRSTSPPKGLRTWLDRASQLADAVTSAVASGLRDLGQAAKAVADLTADLRIEDGHASTTIDVDVLARGLAGELAERFAIAGDGEHDDLRVELSDAGRTVEVGSDCVSFDCVRLETLVLHDVVVRGLRVELHHDGAVLPLIRDLARGELRTELPLAVSLRAEVVTWSSAELRLGQGRCACRGRIEGLRVEANGLLGALNDVDAASEPIDAAVQLGRVLVEDLDGPEGRVQSCVGEALSFSLEQASGMATGRWRSLELSRGRNALGSFEHTRLEPVRIDLGASGGELRLADPWPLSDLVARVEIEAGQLRTIQGLGSSAQAVLLTDVAVDRTAASALTAGATTVDISGGRWVDTLADLASNQAELSDVVVEIGPEQVTMTVGAVDAHELDARQDLAGLASPPPEARVELVRTAGDAVVDASLDAEVVTRASKDDPVPVRWLPALDLSLQARVENGTLEPEATRVEVGDKRLRFLWFELEGAYLREDGGVHLDVKGGPNLNVAPLLNVALGRGPRRAMPRDLTELAEHAVGSLGADAPSAPKGVHAAFEATVTLAPANLHLAEQRLTLTEPVALQVHGTLHDRIVARCASLSVADMVARLEGSQVHAKQGVLTGSELTIGEREDGITLRSERVLLTSVSVATGRPRGTGPHAST